MLTDDELYTLAEAHHWLTAMTAVCALLQQEDEVLDRAPETYLLVVAQARMLWPLIARAIPIQLERIDRYLQRLPRES